MLYFVLFQQLPTQAHKVLPILRSLILVTNKLLIPIEFNAPDLQTLQPTIPFNPLKQVQLIFILNIQQQVPITIVYLQNVPALLMVGEKYALLNFIRSGTGTGTGTGGGSWFY